MGRSETRARPGKVTGRLAVKDVMSSPVVTAKDKTSIREIAKLMAKHGVGAVVITNKSNEPVGMVTEGDIVRRLVSRKRNLYFSKAKHIMSNPVITISRNVNLEDAAKYMVEKKIRKLCVVDSDNKISGIITSTDIMKNEGYLIGVLKEIINSGYVEGEEAMSVSLDTI